MLKINGKDVIFSASFVVADGDDILLKPPGIIGRSIKIIADKYISSLSENEQPFSSDESDINLSVVKIPFADERGFVLEMTRGQLATIKGPVGIRMAAQSLETGKNRQKAMLLHISFLEGCYDNYVDN